MKVIKEHINSLGPTFIIDTGIFCSEIGENYFLSIPGRQYLHLKNPEEFLKNLIRNAQLEAKNAAINPTKE